jgi:hypothetical protein
MFVKEQGEGLSLFLLFFFSYFLAYQSSSIIWTSRLEHGYCTEPINSVDRRNSQGRKGQVRNPVEGVHFPTLKWNSRLITDEFLNVLDHQGVPNPEVLAIGDAARIKNMPLPATAQGSSGFTILVPMSDACHYQSQTRKPNTRPRSSTNSSGINNTPNPLSFEARAIWPILVTGSCLFVSRRTCFRK